MTPEQVALEALETARGSFPKVPRIQRLLVEDEVDMEGHDALRVTVVLPNDTRADELAGENTLALDWAIHQALQSKDIKLFPYVFYATEQELADATAERAREAAG
ncbi:MAG TPA: hypothetical protein VFW87_10035 [Pirellulales bacterium]|nr:hypothetical protein [Pirellulales bacterium]